MDIMTEVREFIRLLAMADHEHGPGGYELASNCYFCKAWELEPKLIPLIDAREIITNLLDYAEDCAAQNDERPSCTDKARALLTKLEEE